MTHKKIKRFQQHGRVRDKKYLEGIRSRGSNELMQTMRDSGYVPVLDVQPAWSVWLREQNPDGGQVFAYLLTIQGVYYGKKRARNIYGVLGQDEIPME
jgi:hypothetical protein